MRFLTSVFIVLFCLTAVTLAGANTVNVATSFPSYQGENGFWAQAYNPSTGSFRNLEDISTPKLPKYFGTPGQGASAPSIRGAVEGAKFLPGIAEWAVLSFQAPETRRYHISGVFFNGNINGATTRGVVFVNNLAAEPLFSGNVTQTQSAAFDLAGVQLNQGDFLRLAVDSLGSNNCDNTFLTAQITYPEPGSMLAMASGLIGFAFLGRRRIRR